MMGMSTNEATQEALKGLMDTFGLPISLRVMSRTHSHLSASGTKDRLPRVAREHCITIRNNGRGESMELVNIGQESINDRNCCVRVFEGNKVGIFSYLVYDNQDAIEPI
jgi:hypothetical protein